MPKSFKRRSFNPKVGVRSAVNRKAKPVRYFVPQGPFNSPALNQAAGVLRHN